MVVEKIGRHGRLWTFSLDFSKCPPKEDYFTRTLQYLVVLKLYIELNDEQFHDDSFQALASTQHFICFGASERCNHSEFKSAAVQLE